MKIIKAAIILLTISITSMAHGKANTASRFSVPQGKAEVPEWLKIFEKKDTRQPYQQQFKSASTSSAAAVSTAHSQRPNSTSAMPAMVNYRNALLERPQISIGAVAPAQITPNYSVTMRLTETNKMVARSGGSMLAVAGGSTLSSTVYQPFNNTAPSEYSSGGGYTPDIGGKRNFPGRPDDRPADASPIGEPWILIAFAALFGGWITLKKRNILTNNEK